MTSPRSIVRPLALGLAALFAGSAMAATTLSHGDAAFLRDAARAGQAEIEASQLALTKATDPQVKTFAQHMIDEHTKAAQDLATLASSKGLKLPTEPSMTERAKMKILSEYNGEKYDYHYAESIGVSAHQDAVKLFRKAADSAKDADVKAFATNTLPTLQAHLDMAKALESTTAAKIGKSK